MMSNSQEETQVKKIIPSKLETGFQQLLYKTIGKIIPKEMTPNQMTTVGVISALIGIICAGLSRVSQLFLIGTICGITGHLIADDLDGYIARTRGMSSKAGAYFDLLTDILHITYLLIALCFSGVIHFYIGIFLVPVYALIIFTAMNYILHLNEFLFPRLGPIETHICFVLVCVVGMIFGARSVATIPAIELFHTGAIGLTAADLLLILGGLPMYFEMVRLQLQLFRRLNQNT